MKRIQIGIDSITTTILPIGFQGENEYTQIVIYWTPVYSVYPEAVATMIIKSPSGEMYTKQITQNNNMVVWDVTASDCVTMGKGQYQLTFTNGEQVIKTYIGNFSVNESLIGSGEAPDPVEDWLQEAADALAEVEGWNNATATITELPIGSSPTVEIEEVSGHKNFDFGLPPGESGEMVVVNVTGTTPSITGESNHRYICGEVSTISITPPASGIIDVIFTSGTTAAVMTVPNTVVFPAWFDATSLEASTTYEINIADGYGVVAKWA